MKPEKIKKIGRWLAIIVSVFILALVIIPQTTWWKDYRQQEAWHKKYHPFNGCDWKDKIDGSCTTNCSDITEKKEILFIIERERIYNNEGYRYVTEADVLDYINQRINALEKYNSNLPQEQKTFTGDLEGIRSCTSKFSSYEINIGEINRLKNIEKILQEE